MCSCSSILRSANKDLPYNETLSSHNHRSLLGSNFRPQPPRGSAPPVGSIRNVDRTFELKSEIHKKLIGSLNMERLSSIPKDRQQAEIGRVVERLLEDE